MTSRMKWMLIVAGIVGLVVVVVFWPTPQQQRVCDIYVEAGADEHDLAYWVKHFSQPEELAKYKELNERAAKEQPSSPFTPQPLAEEELNYHIRQNAKIKVAISARLAISLREVNAALWKCGPHGWWIF